MSTVFYKKGLCFECVRCSNCCRHSSGYVFLSDTDIQKMTAHLNLSYAVFLKLYCRVVSVNGFKRISLTEKQNNDCILWQNDGCSVYASRPLQCASYPFWSSILSNKNTWDETASGCPGMNTGKQHSYEEIKKWLQLRLDEPFIHPCTSGSL